MTVLPVRTVACLALALPIAAHAIAVSGQGTWETTLHARDVNGSPVAMLSSEAVFYYDSVLNITWYTGSYLESTGEFGTQSGATHWASGLAIGSFDNWRLPKAISSNVTNCGDVYLPGTPCGWNPDVIWQDQTDEMAHLFFWTLGNVSYCDPILSTVTSCFGPQEGFDNEFGQRQINRGPLMNFLEMSYWTETATAWDTSRYMYMETWYGAVFDSPGSKYGNAIAVRDGDVFSASAAVPLPASLPLVAIGLVGIALTSTKRKRKDAPAGV